MMPRLFAAALALSLTPALLAQDVRLPLKDGSLKFAVLGDSGTGDRHQREVGQRLFLERSRVPYNFVIMTGDNLYGRERPGDYAEKFEIPYKPLLDADVKFYASLGNHDDTTQRLYKPFNMNGERYYTFKPERSSVRFFALDSNYVDEKQLEWLDKELAASGSDWKIMFFHHPLYSSGGTHGSAEPQRERLEPIFIKHGVNVVIAGHEHFYERVKPQKGIAYFTLGSSAKLRRGDLQKTDLTAKGSDEHYAFMLFEIVDDDLYFEVLSDEGELIDSGQVHRIGKTEPTPVRSTQPVVVTKPASGR
jgi:3',5'-cyclic AMP phosphodiesterase CpdA